MGTVKKLWRKMAYGRPVVVVSGLPRSGTSMTMKMLEAGGLELVVDGVRTADEDNPKGYYELERVKELASEDDKAYLVAARGKGVKVISYLLKDLPRNNNYKVIFMRRNLQEVLASQAKMLDRRGEENETDDEKMIELYENHLWRVGYLFEHADHLEVLELDYGAVLEDPRQGAAAIAAFVGGLDADRMANVVDERLYRNRV